MPEEFVQVFEEEESLTKASCCSIIHDYFRLLLWFVTLRNAIRTSLIRTVTAQGARQVRGVNFHKCAWARM